MSGDKVDRLSLGHAGAADKEWYVDVFLDSARLSRHETVLPDVETVVGREDNVGVVKNTGLI